MANGQPDWGRWCFYAAVLELLLQMAALFQ